MYMVFAMNKNLNHARLTKKEYEGMKHLRFAMEIADRQLLDSRLADTFSLNILVPQVIGKDCVSRR